MSLRVKRTLIWMLNKCAVYAVYCLVMIVPQLSAFGQTADELGEIPLPNEAQVRAANESSLIIIRDLFHGQRFMLQGIIKDLKQIKTADDSYNCLFLEIGPKGATAVQDYMNGTDYNASVGQWISETSHTVGIPFVNIIPEWFLQKIIKINIKVMGMDIDFDTELGTKIAPLIKEFNKNPGVIDVYGPLMVGERSKIFAQNVISSIKSGLCQKAVVVVGAGHLEPLYKPVQAYLIEAEINGVFW